MICFHISQGTDDAQYLLAAERLASFVRDYWFAPAHLATGPGLLESLRFGLRRLYDMRLNVDDDALPISRASVEAAIQTVYHTLAAIDQHTQGGHV